MRSFGVARNLKEDPNESNIDRLLNGTQADVENRVKERDVLKRLRSLASKDSTPSRNASAYF